MKVECRTKARLTLECKEAAEMYTKLEASLVNKTGQCTEEEFAELRRVADTASSLSQQLRRDLDEHTRTHGC
jgi:hypothetical protein